MEIRRVVHGTPDYRSLVELRRQLLRLPIGLDFTEEELEDESCDVFLGMFDQDQAIGSLVLTILGPDEIKMRQVAVAEENRRKGVGVQLVKESEKIAVESGLDKMVVSARLDAVPFYERLGYTLVGEPYIEVGIEHCRLEKQL